MSWFCPRLELGSSCVCCWAQTGEVMEQTSSIMDILAWEWSGNGNGCFKWVCPPLWDLLHCCIPDTEHKLLHSTDLPLIILNRATAGVRRDKSVHEGNSTEFLTQEQFITCSSSKLDVQPPSSPRPGAEGLEPGQTLSFLPQMRSLSKVRRGQ